MSSPGHMLASHTNTAQAVPNYRHLKTSIHEIRLLRVYLDHDRTQDHDKAELHTQFEYHSLDRVPHYHALSYTWGNGRDTHSITVDEKQVKVRDSAGAFLMKLRLIYGEVLVWIDSLCINQQDELEKNSQVEMMGDIYRRAATVQVWLGPSDDESDLVFDRALEVVRWASARKPWGDMVLNPRQYWQRFTSCDVRPALGRLFLRSYWSRVWILQELILAQEITLVCGSSIIPFQAFQELCRIYEMRSFDLERRTDFDRGWMSFDKVTAYRRTPAERPGWQFIFRFFQNNECTNPRDRVYGFRQLFPNPVALPVDYSKSALDIFMDLLRAGFPLQLDGSLDSSKILYRAMQEPATNKAVDVGSAVVDFTPIKLHKSIRIEDCAQLSLLSDWTNAEVSLYDSCSTETIGFVQQVADLPVTIQEGDIIFAFEWLPFSRRDKSSVLRRTSAFAYTMIGYVLFHEMSPPHRGPGDHTTTCEQCTVTVASLDDIEINLTRYSIVKLLS